MNHIIETGRLCKSVELRYTPNEKAVATFSIAVDDGWGDNKKTYFFNVVVWDKKAESCANYLDKGSKVLVGGKLTSRQYEANDGSKRTVFEIVANEVEFLDGKKDKQPSQPPQENDDFLPLNDEDIPF